MFSKIHKQEKTSIKFSASHLGTVVTIVIMLSLTNAVSTADDPTDHIPHDSQVTRQCPPSNWQLWTFSAVSWYFLILPSLLNDYAVVYNIAINQEVYIFIIFNS